LDGSLFTNTNVLILGKSNWIGSLSFFYYFFLPFKETGKITKLALSFIHASLSFTYAVVLASKCFVPVIQFFSLSLIYLI
jgi:hypothetical protein